MNVVYSLWFQVGSYFVGQYYQILRQQPNLVHQFYSDSSSMIRVDGDSVETAHDVLVCFTHRSTLLFIMMFDMIFVCSVFCLFFSGGCDPC